MQFQEKREASWFLRCSSFRQQQLHGHCTLMSEKLLPLNTERAPFATATTANAMLDAPESAALFVAAA